LITESGKIISKTSVEHVVRDDYLNDDKKAQIDAFDSKLDKALDDEGRSASGDFAFEPLYLQDIDIDENPGVAYGADLTTTPTDDEYGDMMQEERPEADDDVLDNYINMELILDQGTDAERRGRVTKRARGLDDAPIGRAHTNPLFDTREYDIEFTDGSIERYHANIIAENMFAQVDDEGYSHVLFDEIIDHEKDNTAIPISEGFERSASGNVKPKMTTRGWKLLVQGKDGSQFWAKLKDLKESNPVELAEYAVANRIADEPAFNWWVPHVLKKRNRIISKVKKRYWRTTHKFGIKLPKSVEEALEIDKITGTDFWATAIKKEMSRVKIAWEAKDGITPKTFVVGRCPR
jgi:hypothetical protein